jgi:hypothetical protein
MRRSSPDAPQGIVPALTVLGALVVVIALTAGSLGSSGGGDNTATGTKAKQGEHAKEGKGGTDDTRPSSTLIYGQTTLFVATTTPYVTTSSTTTTTTRPAEDTLSVRPTGLSFEQGTLSTTFTVRTTSRSAVSFFVIGVPEGMVANPATGRVTRATPVKVNLFLTDPNGARSGVLSVVGSDGSEIRVPVEVAGSLFAVDAVSLQPSRPHCGDPVQISVTVTGDVATQVTAQVGQPGGGSSISLTAVGGGQWQGTLPAAEQGTSVSGTVTATNGSGRTAQQAFSYTVAGGQHC